MRRDKFTGDPGMADLTDFYPTPTQATPNGSGRPAAPGAVASGTPAVRGGIAMAGAPALWMLAFVAASLFLLHKA